MIFMDTYIDDIVENKTYEILLSNGVRFTNLHLNGNNYVSDTLVTEELFVNGLDRVEIFCSDGSKEIINNATLIQIATYGDGKYYFILSETKSDPKETEQQTIRDDITNLQIAIAEVYEMLLA